jgi:hypothetical protein
LLSTPPEKCQFSSHYLSWALVGRKISDFVDQENDRLPARMPGILQAKKGGALIMEGFWLGDKFRVRAETNHSAPTIWYAGTPDRIVMWGRQNPNDLSKFADEYDITLHFVRQLSHEDIGRYPVG